jgi:putative endonuclease
VIPSGILQRLLRYLAGRGPRPGGSRGVGEDWERVAEKALESEGYRILARNFRTRAGELDFIAEDRGVLCFIEVKGRGGTGFGHPGEAVTPEKQRRIYRAAELYLRRRPRRRACRFDVVTILETAGDRRVEIVRGAFEGPPRRRRRRP